MTDFFEAFARVPRPLADAVLEQNVDTEGAAVRDLLTSRDANRLSTDDIRSVVQGNLWMLTPQAFRYFLPAFMQACIDEYRRVDAFAAELLAALTEPTREDVIRALDRAGQVKGGLGMPPETLGVVRQQQLEWFDSGIPQSKFAARVALLAHAENTAVLSFLTTLRDSHAQDFPFEEVQTAIDRHWAEAASAHA